MKDFVELLKQFRQIILLGPPGTGKTWLAKRIVAYMLEIPLEEVDKDYKLSQFYKARFSNLKTDDISLSKGVWEIVQFHPSYRYEDFVKVKEVSQNTTKTVNKIFAKMADEALCNLDRKYILIIDEINRANLASVLGELIYALEYRGKPVYSIHDIEGTSSLIIPENLYIIGTMNTADRSIGYIDHGIKRRFACVSVLPDKSQIEAYYDKSTGKDNTRQCAKRLYELVERIFEYYTSDFFCKNNVQIGHTYFLAKSLKELKNRFLYQVLPILKDYYNNGILIKNPEKFKSEFENIFCELKDDTSS